MTEPNPRDYVELNANRHVRVQRVLDCLERFNDACSAGPMFLPGNVTYCSEQLNRIILEVGHLKAELEQTAVAVLALMGKCDGH